MKSIVALSLLLAFGAEAGTLKTVFKNDKAPTALKYLGVFTNSASGDEYTVAFGEGAQYKVFGTNVATYPKGKSSASSLDEQVKMDSIGVEQNKTSKITITDKRNVKLVDGNYTLHTSASSSQYAQNIDKVVEAEFNKYRRMDNPATPADVHRIFKQIEMDSDYSDPKEFPKFDLQIEWYNSSAPANAQRAAAVVTTAGNDMISRETLKKGSKWFKNHNDAAYDLEEAIDNNVDIENKTFASFSNTVQYEGLSPRLKKAISKQLKTEILEVDGFDCEDSTYTWTSATWVLKDGSKVSYSPGTECD